MSPDWTPRARSMLGEFRCGSHVWGYRPSGTPSVEPTSLACLGLLASADHDEPARIAAMSGEAADWLARIQRADGSLPVSPGLVTPSWSTPYAVLLWNRLKGYASARRRAEAWLLSEEKVPRRDHVDTEKILGHDPTLVGWPWVQGTHSWIEPTAMAIVALCREGRGDHPRVDEGVRLILDRALDHGGWNCGNKAVFGRELRPLPAPTGMALVALAAYGDRTPAIARAIEYLLTALPSIRAPISLGWGVLALRAHGANPAQAEQWLAESFDLIRQRPKCTLGLSLLLLAAGEAERVFVRPKIPAGHSA